jgi:hypothetical protein
VTATGGFLDAGTISTSGAAGALFGLGLIWAVVIATLAAILLIEMSRRLAAVSGRPYGAVIRERFGFSFYLLPLCSELIAETLLLAAEIGGVAIAISLVTGLSWRLLFSFVALSLSPLLIIMNDGEYLGEHTNGRLARTIRQRRDNRRFGAGVPRRGGLDSAADPEWRRGIAEMEANNARSTKMRMHL